MGPRTYIAPNMYDRATESGREAHAHCQKMQYVTTGTDNTIIMWTAFCKRSLVFSLYGSNLILGQGSHVFSLWPGLCRICKTWLTWASSIYCVSVYSGSLSYPNLIDRLLWKSFVWGIYIIWLLTIQQVIMSSTFAVIHRTVHRIALASLQCELATVGEWTIIWCHSCNKRKELCQMES